MSPLVSLLVPLNRFDIVSILTTPSRKGLLDGSPARMILPFSLAFLLICFPKICVYFAMSVRVLPSFSCLPSIAVKALVRSLSSMAGHHKCFFEGGMTQNG